MGYFTDKKAYRVWDPMKQEVVVARNVKVFKSLEEESVELDLRKSQENLPKPPQPREQPLPQPNVV